VKSLDPWRVILTDSFGDIVYPRAYYGHPFYSEIPSWIHYGDSNGTTRQLFDGAFIGAEVPVDTMKATTMMSPYSVGRSIINPYGRVIRQPSRMGAELPHPGAEPRRGLVAEVAPIIAPATGGISVRKEFDDRQVLHVEICVDGKCYKTSMDLAPAIAMVMAKLAQWHEGMHAAMRPSPTTVVVGSVESAIGAAEDAMIGALVARHIDTVCGGFLDDIGNAVKGVASGIASGVSSTFNALKGPIASAAGIAAAAGASAIPGVGLIAAPIAAKLANDLVQSATGDASAKKAVAQATQQAATNPAVAVALDQAKKAVATATVAHHVQHTAKQAARGQPAAQQQIVQVAEDAEKGDPAAKAVADLVANAMHSEWGAKLWERATGRGPGTISGGW
jgi:hypothetical protein